MCISERTSLRIFCWLLILLPSQLLIVQAQDSSKMPADSLTLWTASADSNETVQLEYKKSYWDAKTKKTYKIALERKSNNQFDDLVLIVENDQYYRRVIAEKPLNPEFMEASIHFLHGRPFFFVKNHYQFYLVDMELETFSPYMQPGIDVQYRQDAISGNMSGFQFFDDDKYLLGNAQGYGVFCYNITDITHPVELFRYSSHNEDLGQPYFFLEIQPTTYDWTGFIASSDTLQKNKSIARFYRALKKPRYLFKNMPLIAPTAQYTDPVFFPLPKLWLLRGQPNADSAKWLVVDLVNGGLIKEKDALP